MSKSGEFTHLDGQGRASMVNVSKKPVTHRVAVAAGWIEMPGEVLGDLARLPKGNALEIARIAGIMAAKQTGQLIPLCHPLALDQVQLTIELNHEASRAEVTAEVHCHGRTGVEMEAMTAVSTALLTLYDMAKSRARGMTIGGIRLLQKSGGASGTWKRGDSDG